ncbi:MAG: hypothetical protein IT371_23700 [Deltaproteobacteria bacterium]|nr:hypothetical protein [Deltaproteobacteria bacterium]
MGLFDGISGKDTLQKMERTAAELEAVYVAMATHVIELREQHADLLRQHRALSHEVAQLRLERQGRGLRWLWVGSIASGAVAIGAVLYAVLT